MKINISNKSIITKAILRHKKGRDYSHEIDLSAVLKEILSRANEFVPSESGSILLDDPILKWSPSKEGRLYFLACFGEGSDSLVGTYLPDNVGIVGETYQSCKPYLSKNVKKDKKFFSKIDDQIQFVTKSILAIPIEIEGAVIGVIELINRKGRPNFDQRDLSLLEIFARYTSTLIQNALDARRFEELSKIDDLTGLYNDRFFYEMLSKGVERGLKDDKDITLIFFDLDRFKEVNDMHGHLSGSRVLKEVAILMTEVFLGSNAVMARYGGDEYVILLPDTNLKKASAYAEELRKRIADSSFLKEPISATEPALNISGVITCSVGVASLFENVQKSKNLRSMEENLIKAADGAMYTAKDHGKNRVVVANGKNF
ncbi:MAG: GGDEF domain-containing protein [Proteobacteria bacterium]|nr:GGDEF domain-containing protein [Pseudomonadota bacterium]